MDGVRARHEAGSPLEKKMNPRVTSPHTIARNAHARTIEDTRTAEEARNARAAEESRAFYARVREEEASRTWGVEFHSGAGFFSGVQFPEVARNAGTMTRQEAAAEVARLRATPRISAALDVWHEATR
jgi:hypothetical protein